MITLTYEYKLRPTKRQIAEMEQILVVCCQVWNYALRERKDWLNSRKSPVNACPLHSEYIIRADAPYPSFKLQCQRLTEAKKVNSQLRSVNAQVLQQVLRRLEQSFERHQKLGAGFPRFKKLNRMRSFLFPQLGSEPLRAGAVKLPSLGWVAIRQSRLYPEGLAVKQARVVKRASGFYLMLTFQAELAVPDVPLVGHVAGVDVGLEYFLSTSDGFQVERPKFFVDLQRKLKSLQRRLKRKQIGSANWKKAQAKVARLHEKIANTRKDFHFKQAHKLCDQADVIVIEDLNLIGLSRGMLGKHMLDAGHGQFLHCVLPWVAFKRGKALVKEDARGSSQECPACGALARKDISVRTHECACGCSIPRDLASGLVLRNRYLSRGAHGSKIACGAVLPGAEFAQSRQVAMNQESPAIAFGLAG